jgi:hypothetical protein
MVEVVVVVVVVIVLVVVVIVVVAAAAAAAAAAAVFKTSTKLSIKADAVAHPLQFRACGCDDAAVKTQDFSFAVSSYTLKQKQWARSSTAVG